MDAKTGKNSPPTAHASDGFRARPRRPRAQSEERLASTFRAMRSSCSPASPARESPRWLSARLYAEAQRRYLESVSPYARRLFHQMAVPEVDDDRRPAAGGRAAAAARIADDALVGRQRHHPLQPAAHAVLARRRLSARPAACSTRNRSRRIRPRAPVPMSWPRARLRGRPNASMVPDDTLTIRERAIAAGRRPGTARTCATFWSRLATTSTRRGATSEEGSRLDPVHRRAADGAGLRGLHAGRNAAGAEAQGRAELSGHFHRRPASTCCRRSPPRRAR